MYNIYEVENGDTLASVASKLNISPDVLATLNGLNISAILTPGTYIVVPREESIFTKYIVKKGDTIYQIAQMYNVNPNQLLKLNGLDEGEYIYPQQEIIVPTPNVSFFVTSENDTLNKVLQNLNANPNELVNQNETIYLVPDQLIIYQR